MKKFLTLVFALAMVLSLNVTAFAGNPIKSTEEGSNSDTQEVTVSVNGKTVNVYSVRVDWDSDTTSLTYNKGTKTWDPDTHTYTTAGNGWENNKNSVTVGVYNHSDLPVTATLTTDGTLPTGITGSVTAQFAALSSAVGTSVTENKGAAGDGTATTPYAFATYTLEADLDTVEVTTSPSSITLTVAISPANN